MAGSSIVAKVKAGLKKAYNATGGGTAKTYLKVVTKTENSDPRVGGSISSTSYTELVNAVWQSIDKSYVDNQTVFLTDSQLVVDADVEVSVGDIISYDQSKDYSVVAVMPVRPTNVLLSQKVIVRSQ